MATPGLPQENQAPEFDIKAVPAPQDATGQAQAKSLKAAGVQAEILYAEEFDGTIPKAPPPKSSEASARLPAANQTVTVLAVIVVLGLLIGLWVYFGGRALLAPDTSDPRKAPPAAPEGWAQSLSDLGGNRSLDEIAAMTDRRAALVRLLRLCLLQGAQATSTGFKRSDTEREAYRRLPGNWPGAAFLQNLLTAAELAHYGGRDVIEDDFQRLLQGARGVLPTGGVPHV